MDPLDMNTIETTSGLEGLLKLVVTHLAEPRQTGLRSSDRLDLDHPASTHTNLATPEGEPQVQHLQQQ